jgi:hypothetical protein
MLRRINRVFFNNELPDLPIYYEPTDDAILLTHTIDAVPTRITVDPALKGYNRIIKLYLAHEMIHVKHPKIGHGKRFDAEIQRLCKIPAYRKLL